MLCIFLAETEVTAWGFVRHSDPLNTVKMDTLYIKNYRFFANSFLLNDESSGVLLLIRQFNLYSSGMADFLS